MKSLKKIIVIVAIQWHFRVARRWKAGRIVNARKSKWRTFKFRCALAIRDWLAR